MHTIKFGTDGWRAVIADGFTFSNVEKVAQAVADHLGKKSSAIVGYDTRFMSPAYARLAGEVLTGNGIKTILAGHYTPTPMLSYTVKNLGLNGGIMVTASHNPYTYNGIKFKEPFGGSALPETTKKIEKLVKTSVAKKSEAPVPEKDISSPYVETLKRYINRKSISKKRFRIVVDSMYGAGGYYLEKILKGFGHEVVTIHGDPNPLFPGMNPEPIEVNLKELSNKVRNFKADIGIATDGDADRVGIVDGSGKFLTPHQVLSLLFLHLLNTRSQKGMVVKTISTTSLINKIAGKYNIELKETPVGFKYIADWMLKDNVLLGGEESGGNGFRDHIPERDGMLSGLLLVEMMGVNKKSIKGLIKDMEKEFGPYRYKRIDQNVPQERIRGLYDQLNHNTPDKIAGRKVKEIKNYDGIKLICEDDSWILFRGSGTEPLLRMYAEARTDKQVAAIIKKGQELVKKA